MSNLSPSLTIDEGRRELMVGARSVDLEPRVFDFVAYLAAHSDRVVPKDELLEAVWPDLDVGEGSLQRAVSVARAALRAAGAGESIRTFTRRGYRFCPDGPTPAAVVDPISTIAPAHAAYDDREWQRAVRLDVAATSLVGREAEFARLGEMLGRPGCRLITLLGPGGVGKTRVASELVDRLRREPREVLALCLESVRTDGEMLVAMARAMGLDVPRPAVPDIARWLANREVLLVLDNLEHLLPAAADVLARLVVDCPCLRVVVTSREVLGLTEEWVFPVEGLSWQADGDTADAVRLFLEREAQAGADEAGADECVTEICRLVDGMPLAIELAASLRRYMTREAIAEAVGKDVAVLRSDARNLPPRHRTIPGLLEQSCEHLAEDHARALFSLGVFEGSFTARAARNVANADTQVMRNLVDRSLVQARSGRFALHPLLRQFARERVGDGWQDLRRRHAEFYAAFLESQRDALDYTDQAGAVSAVEADLSNVLSAWGYACETVRLDLLDKASYPLSRFAQMRARWPELRDAIETAVEVAGEAGDSAWRTHATLSIYQAWERIRTSPGPSVIEPYARARDLFAAQGELPPPGLGTDTVAMEGLFHWAEGRYQDMGEAAEAARQRATSRGDVLGEVFALYLGAVARNRSARVLWEGDSLRRGSFRPIDAEAEADVREADSYLDRATVLLSGRGERWFRSYILYERALNAKTLGDAQAAVRLTQESHDLRSEFGDSRGVAEALISMAGTYADMGAAELSEDCCRRAEPIVQRLADPGMLAEFLRMRAFALWLRGNIQAGFRDAVAAVELSFRIGSINNVLGSLRVVSDLLADSGAVSTATEADLLLARHPACPALGRARAIAALRSAGEELPATGGDGPSGCSVVGLEEFAASILARIPMELGRSGAAA